MMVCLFVENPKPSSVAVHMCYRKKLLVSCSVNGCFDPRVLRECVPNQRIIQAAAAAAAAAAYAALE